MSLELNIFRLILLLIVILGFIIFIKECFKVRYK